MTDRVRNIFPSSNYACVAPFANWPPKEWPTESYLKICENPVFDPDTDILRCKIGHKVLQLRNPYQCLSDISVNPFMELQC